jgi:hypothetical protein
MTQPPPVTWYSLRLAPAPDGTGLEPEKYICEAELHDHESNPPEAKYLELLLNLERQEAYRSWKACGDCHATMTASRAAG